MSNSGVQTSQSDLQALINKASNITPARTATPSARLGEVSCHHALNCPRRQCIWPGTIPLLFTQVAISMTNRGYRLTPKRPALQLKAAARPGLREGTHLRLANVVLSARARERAGRAGTSPGAAKAKAPPEPLALASDYDKKKPERETGKLKTALGVGR